MKINIKEEFVFIELKETKNKKYSFLIVGAKDYSGTTSFLVDNDDLKIDFKERDLIEVGFYIYLENKKVGDSYKEVVVNKRIVTARLKK